jgi:hypothetical protein
VSPDALIRAVVSALDNELDEAKANRDLAAAAREYVAVQSVEAWDRLVTLCGEERTR